MHTPLQRFPLSLFLSRAIIKRCIILLISLSVRNYNLQQTADTVVIDRLSVGGGVPLQPNRQTRIAYIRWTGGPGRWWWGLETRSLRSGARMCVCLRCKPLPVAGIGSS